jgi:hypothetical protein
MAQDTPPSKFSPHAELWERLKGIDLDTLTELTFSTELVTANESFNNRDTFRDRFVKNLPA